MALTPGTRIGAFEITGTLGAGGMGEVYRARDSKLKREVALKVLPAEVANDRERLARFQREAEVLAALNHPNIAHIHGLEEAHGTTALVMELVEGEDLAQRIARGPIPIDEALPIATQIAEALAAAHGQAIIHRDLKPANIKVRPDGAVKVLDFGLAKALDPGSGIREPGSGNALANSPTITSPAMTMRGVILGTAAYMSPEQARGKAVDTRTDIWAFGVILFEMLAGRRPLDGETTTDVLGAIVKSEPEWKALPVSTPAPILRLLRRALEKDVRRRLADIADARFDLDEADAPPDATVPGAAARQRPAAWIAAAVLAVIAVVAVWGWTNARRQSPPRGLGTWVAATLTLDTPDLTALADRFAVAPDGSAVVVVGPGGGLFLRRPSALEAVPIPGAPPDAFSPAFSPDGRWIAFATERAVMKIPTEGGTPATITRSDATFINLSWGEDDRIRYPAASTGDVGSVSSAGGPVELITVDSGARISRAEWLPGGRLLVSMAAGPAMTVAIREADGTLRVVVEGWNGRLTPAGSHLLYSRPEGTTWSLVAVPFETETATLDGEAVVIVRDIAVNLATPAAATTAGDLFYIGGKARSDRRVVAVDRSGAERDVALPSGAWVGVAPSPDGRQLALNRWEGARRTIWTMTLATGALTQVTYAEDTFMPQWMPDGKRLLFTYFPRAPEATRTSMWSVLTDGRGRVEPIPAELDAYPMAVSSDARTLYYRASRSNVQQSDIYTLELGESGAVPAPLLTTPSVENWPIPSPNGRWLAYATNASGTDETRVAPLDDLSAVVQVSARGGRPVGWSPDGKRLYYTDGDTIAVVEVDSRGPLLTSRRAAFHLPRDRSGSPAVMPDGERAILIRGGALYSDLVMVLGALAVK